MSEKACVLLDANSWFSERLLRSGMGAALIHLLLRQQRRIGLPESVELETTQRLIDEGAKAIERQQRDTRLLEQLTGQPPRQRPLEEAAVNLGIEQRWQELAPIVERLPLSMDIVRAALDRVIRKMPPAQGKEEFRDSCLWEQAVQMAAHCEVHLITKDGAFYNGHDASKGLAAALRDQAAKLSNPIRLHRTVEDYLACLGDAASVINEGELAQEISAYIEAQLRNTVAERNFELGLLDTFSVKGFPTDKPTAIAISYQLTYELTDQNVSQQRSSANVTAYGDFTFDPTIRAISDVRPDRETFRWVDGQGISQQSTIQYAYAHAGGTSMLGSPHALLFSPRSDRTAVVTADPILTSRGPKSDLAPTRRGGAI
jgi:hypothetical protein